jgi:hypothetical protein
MKATSKRHAAFTSILALTAVLLLSNGCTTTTTYHEASEAGKPSAADYPIPVYTENMTVPRPTRLIGTIVIGDTYFTMIGGTVEKEMATVTKKAHEVGADAVQVKAIQKPGYTDTNYRVTADLEAYSDTWETIDMSSLEFKAYLKANQATLDPIEGVWYGRGLSPHYIGIMRNTAVPGREFVGFILGSENAAWHKGYKKVDIRHGDQPGTYILDYYLDNFSHREAIVTLSPNFTFTLLMERSENDDSSDNITYIKNW